MPRLDYRPRLDERNKAYRVAPVADLQHVARYWSPGVVLDQGQEGSCVGHGTVGEYLASPVRGKVRNADAGHALAVQVYDRAKEIDEYEGVNYEGTSVRAGMLVHRERGWCSGFKWAMNMAELRTALELGPVVIGVSWSTDAMNDTLPDGTLEVFGDLAAGHCVLVTGYSPKRGYRFLNSWGRDWGQSGQAYVSPADLDRILFQAGGEAAVPTGRHL